MSDITIPAQTITLPDAVTAAQLATTNAMVAQNTEDSHTALANLQGALDRISALENRVTKLEAVPPVVTPPVVTPPVVVPPVVVPPVVVPPVVTPPATTVTAVDIGPKDPKLAPGAQLQMIPKVNGAVVTTLPTGVYVDTNNPAIATIDPVSFLVTAVAAGAVNIQIHGPSGMAGWSSMTVAGAPVPTPPPSSTTKSVTLTAVPADSVVDAVAVCTHVAYYDQPAWGSRFTQTINAIKTSGVRYFRDGFDGGTDTVKNAQITKNLQAVAALGLKGIMVMSPLTNAQGALDFTTSNVDMTVAALGPALYAFEGNNEVDNNNAAYGGQGAYVAKAKGWWQSAVAYAKTKVAAGVKFYSLTVTGDAAAASMGDVSQGMDAVAIHPYPPQNGTPTSNIARELSAKAPLNTRRIPWVATESGYHCAINSTGWAGVSEAAQSKYEPRMLFDYLLAGIQKVCFYQFADGFVDTGKANAEAQFGWLRYDGTQKPVYTVMQRVLALYADVGGTATPRIAFDITAPSTVKYHLAAKKNGQLLLALWNDVAVYDTAKKADIANAPVAVTLKFAQSYTGTSWLPFASAGSSALGSGATFNVGVPDSVLILTLA
ncbi:MAG: hypothetical protein H0U66_06210 [Gemmatimonadaceae bacterium]|nr:hypothetical protein [Gemmatimonadaceae bacterium]